MILFEFLGRFGGAAAGHFVGVFCSSRVPGTRSDKQNFLIKNLICRRRKSFRVKWEPYYCKKVSGFHGTDQSWIISEFPVVDLQSSHHTHLDQEKIDFQAIRTTTTHRHGRNNPQNRYIPPSLSTFPHSLTSTQSITTNTRPAADVVMMDGLMTRRGR